jgi:HD-like signal output (HDOD) protein
MFPKRNISPKSCRKASPRPQQSFMGLFRSTEIQHAQSFVMFRPEQIWSSSHLPTLPAVAVKLLKLSEDPLSEIHQVAQVIKTDPAITAKILKSTNSSYFAFRNEVTSIDRAVPLLGATMVTSLALSFSLVEAAMTAGPLVNHYQRYWMKSVVQAVAAEMLGEQTRVKDQFFLAGLLADLGRLAMLKTIGQEYALVIEDAEESHRDLLEVEREKLGFDYI